jgi:general stress protein 26
MDANDLLKIAREIIAKVPMCFAITVDQNGEANARVVQTAQLSDQWTVRYTTDRRSRKVREIERSGKMTLAYQFDPANEYVTLIGRATIIDDPEIKNAIWQPSRFRWYPGGPNDPNVVLIDFVTDRIELWSSHHGVLPDPAKGLWAAALTRESSGWRCHATSSMPQASWPFFIPPPVASE